MLHVKKKDPSYSSVSDWPRHPLSLSPAPQGPTEVPEPRLSAAVAGATVAEPLYVSITGFLRLCPSRCIFSKGFQQESGFCPTLMAPGWADRNAYMFYFLFGCLDRWVIMSCCAPSVRSSVMFMS